MTERFHSGGFTGSVPAVRIEHPVGYVISAAMVCKLGTAFLDELNRPKGAK